MVAPSAHLILINCNTIYTYLYTSLEHNFALVTKLNVQGHGGDNLTLPIPP